MVDRLSMFVLLLVIRFSLQSEFTRTNLALIITTFDVDALQFPPSFVERKTWLEFDFVSTKKKLFADSRKHKLFTPQQNAKQPNTLRNLTHE